MDHFESITKKLSQYLVQKKGFTQRQDELSKTLTDEKDIICPDDAFILCYEGKLFGGKMEYVYDMITDNYVTTIEEDFEDFLSLTEGEKKWLYEGEEENTGWDAVSEWIRNTLSVVCDKRLVNRIATTSIRKHLSSAT